MGREIEESGSLTFDLGLRQQIRAIHAATHAELDRGETAFKKIKDQVGALLVSSPLSGSILHELEERLLTFPSSSPPRHFFCSTLFLASLSPSPSPLRPSSSPPFPLRFAHFPPTEVYSLKVNKALDSINTLNAQPIDLGA